MAEEDKEIMTATVTEMESGESWGAEFKLFPTDMELMAIVKVERVEIYADTDNPKSTQLTVECKALDSHGFVYNLNLEFTPETEAERDVIVSDMKSDVIYMVKGRYSICQEDLIIDISYPEYLPLPPSFDEEHVREVFKVNGNALLRVQ